MLLGSQTSIYTNCDGGHNAGYSYFSIRGIDQTRINITLNGVPLNEPEDLGCYTSNYPSFTSAIHSIQIQRGVGTSSNGASSFGGSLNFQSKDGLVKGTDIQIGGGSFNTSRFDISTSTGLSKHKLALFANIGGIQTDGFRDNSGCKGGSAFVSLGYFGKSSITKLNLLTGISQNKQAWMGSSDEALAANYRDNPRGGDNMDNFNQTNVQLQNITMFNTRFKLTSTAFYNYLDGHYNVFNLQDTALNFYYAYESQYSRWIGGITQLDYNYGDFKVSSSLSASTYTRFHSGNEIFFNTLINNWGADTYTNNGRKNDANAFIKVSYDTKKVLYYVDLQGRFVDYNYSSKTSTYQSWNFFNPKVGIKVFINKSLDAYWNLGVSHREPTHSIMLSGALNSETLTLIKPESVGKSTMVKKLAEHLGCKYIEEFGRTYTELFGTNNLEIFDFESIAHWHNIEIENAEIDKYLIVDTEAITTKIFAEMYLGKRESESKFIDEIISEQHFDLYLVLNVDVPWVDDGTRDFPEGREVHLNTIISNLEERGLEYKLISGDNYDERFEKALEEVKKLG